MDDEPEYYYPDEGDAESRPRDSKIDEAKEFLLERLFSKRPDSIFFQRQVQLFFERDFFHWITAKALAELADEGKIKSMKESLIHPPDEDLTDAGTDIRFFASRQNRYWRRQAKKTKALVHQYSHHDFARPIGDQGEMMFDAILAEYGFTIAGRNVRQYQGREWTETKENLDRVYLRDGIAYGAEIKNTLDYIPHDELNSKTRLARWCGPHS